MRMNKHKKNLYIFRQKVPIKSLKQINLIKKMKGFFSWT